MGPVRSSDIVPSWIASGATSALSTASSSACGATTPHDGARTPAPNVPSVATSCATKWGYSPHVRARSSWWTLPTLSSAVSTSGPSRRGTPRTTKWARSIGSCSPVATWLTTSTGTLTTTGRPTSVMDLVESTPATADRERVHLAGVESIGCATVGKPALSLTGSSTGAARSTRWKKRLAPCMTSPCNTESGWIIQPPNVWVI